MAQEIKITQTSNADMNIGVPKTLTAVEWLEKLYKEDILIPKSFEQAKQMEKKQIEAEVNNVHEYYNRRRS